MHSSAYEYGVLIPHFGTATSRSRVLDGARLAEALGFDSVWVRDHIVYRPHGHEDPNPVHIDPFVTLSAIAAVTARIRLGSAVLIPHRHPIHSALLLGSLDFIAGGNRVIAGWGVGNFDHEFDAIGAGNLDRRELIREHLDVVRRLLSGESVSHHGRAYQFDDVSIAPVPGERQIPIWYGGGSRAAVRRAAEYCDGWIASRMPRFALAPLRDRMVGVAEQLGRPVPDCAVVPYVLPADTIEEAESRISLEPLLRTLQKSYPNPPNGRLNTVSDLDGALIAGPPSHIISEVRKYQAIGVRHFVFDFRPDAANFEEHVTTVGECVLPELRRSLTEPIAAHPDS